jgi:serine protease Do
MFLSACGGGSDTKSTPVVQHTGTAASTTPAALDAATILTNNQLSVVRISTTSPQGDGGGSGIVWEDGMHILTNAHVVIGTGSIKVSDPSDSSRNYPAKVVALSACDDVALLSVDQGTFKPAKIGNSDDVKPADKAVALGFPGNLGNDARNKLIVTEGIISQVHATFDFQGQNDLLETTAPINPGNSGGPLFNTKGEVIGINSYTAIGTQAENYAITSNEAKRVADKLKSGKNLDYIGVNLIRNTPDLADTYDLPYTNGLIVAGVDPGSAAAKANPNPLQYPYLIFSIDGTEVPTVGALCDVIRSRSSGATVKIQFGAYNQNNQPVDTFTTDVVIP